jgi:hypothetical protein
MASNFLCTAIASAVAFCAVGSSHPVGPEDAETLLVDIDVDRVLGVENVVEGDEHDTGLLGALDHRAEGCRVLCVDDDRVKTGIDEVVDGGDLRRNILAGRNDLELLELGGDVGLCRIGLRRLHHLDAPGVGDEAVRKGDPIGSFLFREFEELRVSSPWREALRFGSRAADDLRLGACGRGGENNRGSGEQATEERLLHRIPSQ